MTDQERIQILRYALARLNSQANIELAAGGNGFDIFVAEVSLDALESTGVKDDWSDQMDDACGNTEAVEA